MRQFSSVLSNKTLAQISIPGAHHSGFLSTNWWMDAIEKWTVCQSKGITALLDHGVRYLDLRIGESMGTLYFSHTVLSKQKFRDGLAEIRLWIENHASEVLILDIRIDQEWKGKDKTRTATQELPVTIRSVFGQLLMNSTNGDAALPLQKLLEQGKRIAIIGDGEVATMPSRSSWSSANSNNWAELAGKLEDYLLESQHDQLTKSGSISVISAAVTPSIKTWPAKVASKLNANLTNWIQQLQKKPAPLGKRLISGLGVIEHDFVDDDLVDAVISFNL